MKVPKYVKNLHGLALNPPSKQRFQINTSNSITNTLNNLHGCTKGHEA